MLLSKPWTFINQGCNSFLSDLSDCPPGYYGKTCNNLCKQPYYGIHCTNECNCSERECNPIFGCRDPVSSPVTETRSVNIFHHDYSGLKIICVYYIQINLLHIRVNNCWIIVTTEMSNYHSYNNVFYCNSQNMMCTILNTLYNLYFVSFSKPNKNTSIS